MGNPKAKEDKQFTRGKHRDLDAVSQAHPWSLKV